MARYALTPYVIKVRKRRSGEPLPLGHFDGDGGDALDAFAAFLDGRCDVTDDQRRQSLSQVTCRKLDGRRVDGLFRSGEYGFATEIYDRGGVIAHRKAATEADLVPFYFAATMPADGTEGLFVLQRFKQFGVRGAFLRAWEADFRRRHAGYRLDVEALVPEGYFDGFLRSGTVKQLRLRRRAVPHDLADLVRSGVALSDVGGYTELVVAAARGGGLPLLDAVRDAWRRRRPPEALLQIAGGDWESARVEIQLGSTKRTLDLDRLTGTTAAFDIDGQVACDDVTGFPTLQSLRDAAADLENALVRELRWDP